MKNKIKRGFLLLVGLMACAHAVLAADHLAIVTQKGRAGVIDLQGRVVLPLEYKKIEVEQGETDAVILVEKDGKYGMYDRQGKVIIAPTFKKVGPFSDGMLAAGTGKDGHFMTVRARPLLPIMMRWVLFPKALRL